MESNGHEVSSLSLLSIHLPCNLCVSSTAPSEIVETQGEWLDSECKSSPFLLWISSHEIVQGGKDGVKQKRTRREIHRGENATFRLAVPTTTEPTHATVVTAQTHVALTEGVQAYPPATYVAQDMPFLEASRKGRSFDGRTARHLIGRMVRNPTRRARRDVAWTSQSSTAVASNDPGRRFFIPRPPLTSVPSFTSGAPMVASPQIVSRNDLFAFVDTRAGVLYDPITEFVEKGLPAEPPSAHALDYFHLVDDFGAEERIPEVSFASRQGPGGHIMRMEEERSSSMVHPPMIEDIQRSSYMHGPGSLRGSPIIVQPSVLQSTGSHQHIYANQGGTISWMPQVRPHQLHPRAQDIFNDHSQQAPQSYGYFDRTLHGSGSGHAPAQEMSSNSGFMCYQALQQVHGPHPGSTISAHGAPYGIPQFPTQSPSSTSSTPPILTPVSDQAVQEYGVFEGSLYPALTPTVMPTYFQPRKGLDDDLATSFDGHQEYQDHLLAEGQAFESHPTGAWLYGV